MDATTALAGNVIVSCFFGSDIKDEQIEGKKIPCFIKEMIGDLAVQIFDPLTILFNIRLINWGIRQKDREVNRKIQRKTFSYSTLIYFNDF